MESAESTSPVTLARVVFLRVVNHGHGHAACVAAAGEAEALQARGLLHHHHHHGCQSPTLVRVCCGAGGGTHFSGGRRRSKWVPQSWRKDGCTAEHGSHYPYYNYPTCNTASNPPSPDPNADCGQCFLDGACPCLCNRQLNCCQPRDTPPATHRPNAHNGRCATTACQPSCTCGADHCWWRYGVGVGAGSRQHGEWA